MAIKMQLRHLGLDTSGDRETLIKRLEEASRKAFEPVMEPIEEPMDTSPTLNDSVWSQGLPEAPKVQKSTKRQKIPRKKPPIEQRLGPKLNETNDSFRQQWKYKKPKFIEPPLVEHFEEFPIQKMEERAERLSDMPLLRKRKYRFDEETATEFTSVTEAKKKNLRLERFKTTDHGDDDENDVEVL